MSWKKSIAAGCAGIALAATLNTTTAAPKRATPPAVAASQTFDADRLIAELTARPARGRPGFDLAALEARLGDKVALSYSSAGFDQGLGAFRISALIVTLKGDEPATLFTADEVRLWNADSAALLDRLSGRRLGETIRLFDRVEFTGLKFDFTGTANTLDQATQKAVVETLGGDGDVALEDQAVIRAATGIIYDKASMKIGRLILSGLTLHPWTFQESEGEDEGLAAIRVLSAFGRSFSFEALAYDDAVMIQAYTQDGTSNEMTASYDWQVFKGYDRGRLTAAYGRAAEFEGRLVEPAIADEGEPIRFAFAGRSGETRTLGFDVSNLLAWGERGELPPVTERDLMSFGDSEINDFSLSLAGTELFRADKLAFSADEFAWILPEELSVAYDGMKIDVTGLIELAASVEADADPEMRRTLAALPGLIRKHGLHDMPATGHFSAQWDAETGKVSLRAEDTTRGYLASDLDISLTLPSYAALIPAFGQDGKTPDDAAIKTLLTDTFSLNRASLTLSDLGGLSKLAGLAIDFDGLMAEIRGSSPTLAGQTPEGVRAMASGFVLFGASSLVSKVPQGARWAQALGDFVAGGGTLTVELKPAAPLNAAAFQTLGADPASAKATLGFDMRRTPPQ